MKMLISLVFLLASILYYEAFEVQPAWGNDLKISLENEVAGASPGMEIFSADKGANRKNENPMATGSYPDIKKTSKAKKSNYSPKLGVLSERKLANAGFIVPRMRSVGTITKLFEQKLGTTGPDEVYVDIGKRQGIEKGDRFTVYSLDRYIYHPVLPGHKLDKLEEYERRVGYGAKEILSHPGKPLGHRVKIHGVLEITESGDKLSSARVVKAYESIETGDLLTPYQKPVHQTSKSSKTDKSIEGYIVAAKGDRIGIKYDDFVYIDKGWEDEVRPGDRFEVFFTPNIEKSIWYKLKPEKTPLLPVVLGEIKVVATQKKTATAIVIKSRMQIEVGNPIRFKPSHHPG